MRRAPASGLSSRPSIAARRSALASGLSSTPSIALRGGAGAVRRTPCAGEQAKLDAVDCVAGAVRRAPPAGEWTQPEHSDSARVRSHLSRACSYSQVSLGVLQCCLALTRRSHSRSARARSKAHSVHESRACSYSRVSLGALQCCLALTRRAHSRSARARSKAHSVHDGLALSRPSCIAPITKHNLVCDALHHLNFEMAALKTYWCALLAASSYP